MASLDNDEFGDASFLENFDADAVIAAHISVDEKPSKKARVSLSPEKHNKTRTSPPTESLEECLGKNFGFSSFRPGQEQAVRAILDGRDVAIFWATGSGKSICYQLPALYSGRVSLVISPLISLMQDQVHKLNGLSERNVATYLGSAQTDSYEETKALRGEYPLVYVTPEKLMANGFLDRLSTVDLCLIAVDESHCVSQWGHDFRKEYRAAGTALREHSQLSRVPIMALTATAVPRIQKDIISNLKLRSPCIDLQSFDRPNLIIKVATKDTSNALQSAMEPLIRTLKKKVSSTIIYAPTRTEVESIAGYLQQRFEAEGCSSIVRAQGYHAGLSDNQRYQAHVNYLTGETAVIVATIAFGMGIDKCDTRRIVHYGPPKTVEEYYQQIGRAGRDGLPAECIMYTSPSDFDRYLSDFYLGSLEGSAKEASVQSTKSLKEFALNREKCRRKSLLDFFHERPSFGERCGTCDNCKNMQKYGEDGKRDFGDVARIILAAVAGLREQGLTIVVQVANGKVLESYRYEWGTNGEALKTSLDSKRAALPKKVTIDQWKEFTTALVQKRYLEEVTKKKSVNGFDRSWTCFKLSQLGHHALNNTGLSIVLTVPESIREAERQQEMKRQRVLQKLEERGVKVDQLPQEEVEQGDGEVIRAYTKWHNYIATQEKNGNLERTAQLEELILLVQEWRSNAAVQFRMAPSSVLPEHILYSITYAAATLPRGIRVDKCALVSAGARARELDSLADILNDWAERYRPRSEEAALSQSKTDAAMVFPVGPVKPTLKWAYAVYKPNKKTGLASWESSYQRFENGESPQAIAMSPANGKPIQVATVVSHIQAGFELGYEVDLHRLASYSMLPTKGQWVQLEQAEEGKEINVVGDPTISGADGDTFTLTDLLRPIMGDEFSDTPYQERSEEGREKFSSWCQLAKWYMLLKRTGMTPKFIE